MLTVPTLFSERLAAKVQELGSAVCVGLDPRKNRLPGSLRLGPSASPADWAKSYRQFCCETVDAIVGSVPAIKPQAAFFEQLGPAGMEALHATIQYARKRGLLVILDGKRNDIGSTAMAYAEAYLGGAEGAWGSDALTVSPYLGSDSLEPFVQQCDQTDSGIFVLVKTSNPGGGMLQDRLTDGTTVYHRVAQEVYQFNTSRIDQWGYGPVGAVVGGTYPEQLAELRENLPNAWILIPGFGAQGGQATDVQAGFDERGLGAIINSSRKIIFAYQDAPYADKYGEPKWQEAVAQAVIEMNDQLRAVTTLSPS